jgi:hypothetical protein
VRRPEKSLVNPAESAGVEDEQDAPMSATTDNVTQNEDKDTVTSAANAPDAPEDGDLGTLIEQGADQPIDEVVDEGAEQETGAPVEAAPAHAVEDRPIPEAEELTGIAAVEAEILAEADQQPDAAYEEETPLKSLWEGALPEVLMRIVDARISVWQKLMEIDRRRGELQSLVSARETRDEFARQARELKKNPGREILEKGLERQGTLLKNPVLKNPPPPDPRAKQPIDENKVYKLSLEIGATQTALFLQRMKLDAAIPASALPAAADEPLLNLCRRHGVDAGPLVGWTYYALAVQQRLDQYRAKEKEHNQKLSAAQAEDRGNKGLMSVFRGGSKTDDVAELDPAVLKVMRAARSELQAIEPQLVELFWSLYEQLAWLYAEDKLEGDDITVVRAFLRYGLVSAHPGLIPAETLQYIMGNCEEDVYEWTNTPQATHVVYADEYIAAIHDHDLTVSPDENLELNERGTDVWKADRVWRQAVICKARTELYKSERGCLQKRIDELQAAADKKQERVDKLRCNPRARAEMKKLEQEALGIKATIARLRHGLEHIDTRVIPKTEQQHEEAERKLSNEVSILAPETVVKREARFIRYMCRLGARLKEFFPQFVLRDCFEPNRNDHHHRQAVLSQIQDYEKLDRRMFHQTLVSNKRLDRQISVRMSPVFLLTPVRGQMGMSISPRKWDDNGRIVMPLLSQRQGVLDILLINLLADFRWDCSKEEAGMDWIMADALCAAYAAARWNTRKLPDKAQKMMGFDPKQKDKPNFRAHYALFVTSAAQQGRLLFSKCDEVYKVMIKYVGLPPGVEVLKRD